MFSYGISSIDDLIEVGNFLALKGVQENDIKNLINAYKKGSKDQLLNKLKEYGIGMNNLMNDVRTFSSNQPISQSVAPQFTQYGPPIFFTPHPNTQKVIGFDQNIKPILTQYNLYNDKRYQFSHEQLILLANILNQRGCSTDELMNLVNQYQSGNKKPFIDLVIKSGIGKQTIFESEIANFLNYKGIPTNEALSCINDNVKMANLLNAVGINTEDALKIVFGKDEEIFARIKNV